MTRFDEGGISVNEKPLQENIEQLRNDIVAYQAESEKWYKYNQSMRNLLIILSVMASVGATVAGIWAYPHLAATFAAVSAAVISIQGSLK